MRILSRAACVLVLAACHGRSAPDDTRAAAIAPAELGPAKKPPNLRAPHPASPALPDLPPLAAHESTAAPPTEIDAAEHPCRAVWTGERAASLACARALLFGGGSDAGATPVVPRKLLSRTLATLPAVVDHRVDGSEGPLRDQASAPACTAFATATAIDHALLRWGGQRAAVSVMQIWSRYHSPRVDSSLASNLGLALGAEQSWPFSPGEAVSWVPCDEFAKPPRAGCGRPVDDARLRNVIADVVGEFTEIEYLAVPLDTSVLDAKLAGGQDVIVAMELPRSFVPRGRPGAQYVPHYTRSAGSDAGHALVLAGYARLPHGTYYLAHNSWGWGWGDGGYAWIHEQTLAAWVRQVVALDAEPVERAAGSRPKRSRGETTCAGDLVPDSIRGTCAPACPDGSPRHDGVCPVAGQCPPSYVNLTGACVLAAPATTGRDPDSGVAWTCGPGGCSYVLPRRVDPECTGATCKASCPAPDFHVARMGSRLVCIE
ncbi:MAG: hypothetical protein JOZ69_01630 [Myxococcales bacterium]|nr:hypothetical protein [Myxococcales bacterium]